jgi:hypothetical protein
MQTRILFSLLAFFLSCSCFSQGKYEIGAEGGITFDYYKINDPKNLLTTVPCISGGGGVSFRQNGNKNFFYEAALFYRETSFGYKYKYESGYSVTNGDNLFSVPLRVGYYVHVSRKFMVSPVVGIAPSFVTFSAQSGGEELYTNNGTTVHITYQQRDLQKDFFVLMQGGLSIDFIITKAIRFSVNPTYYAGTSDISAYDVHYNITNIVGTTQGDAVITGKGSYLAWNVGIRYMLPRKKG